MRETVRTYCSRPNAPDDEKQDKRRNLGEVELGRDPFGLFEEEAGREFGEFCPNVLRTGG
jgi:hypothetical protein